MVGALCTQHRWYTRSIHLGDVWCSCLRALRFIFLLWKIRLLDHQTITIEKTSQNLTVCRRGGEERQHGRRAALSIKKSNICLLNKNVSSAFATSSAFFARLYCAPVTAEINLRSVSLRVF